ncbi:hypothetical protein ACK8GE_14380 [Micromonosporaceae bacterium DT194]|uniref:hypothetical protein n=1 Tax=Melissospora conviva TaxID=3388432 RepID=UPI003C261C64
MRKPAGTSAVLFGLGVGATAGSALGPAAFWPGVAIIALGIVLSLVGTAETDLVGDDPDKDSPVTDDGTGRGTAVVAHRRRRSGERPTLAGLGTRVEQILKLAEEQGNDHRAEARREAEAIVAAARRKAEAILNEAHQQAAGPFGTRRDWSPIRPDQAVPPQTKP